MKSALNTEKKKESIFESFNWTYEMNTLDELINSANLIF
jgi:hypothetical protein